MVVMSDSDVAITRISSAKRRFVSGRLAQAEIGHQNKNSDGDQADRLTTKSRHPICPKNANLISCDHFIIGHKLLVFSYYLILGESLFASDT